MCIFSSPGGTGIVAYFSSGDYDLGDAIGPQGMNNNTESAWNRTSSTWCGWDGAGYPGGPGGRLVTIDPGEQLGITSTNTANKISSLKPCYS
jgi:hypothetical protein